MDRARAGRASQRFVGFCPGSAFAILTVLFLPVPVQGQIEPIHLEGIVVTGTPVARIADRAAAFVTVLEGEELRAKGIARVTEALAEVPGLVVLQSGSYGSVSSVFFRGSESDHVKVLLDGVEVNQAGGSFDFSGLLMADVERIEVARGPASALYGSDALAGVIQIMTRRGRGGTRGSVSMRIGSYRRQEWAADLHGGSGTTSYSFSASEVTTDGILEFNNQFRSTTLSGAVFLTPDEKTRIGLTGRYGDRIYHFPTDGAGNVVDRNAFSFGDEVILGLEAIRMLTDRLELRGAVRTYGWDGGSDDRADGPSDNLGYFEYTSLDAFQRSSVDLRVNANLTGGLVLSLGVEVEEEDQRSFSESLSEYGPSSNRSRHSRANRGYYAHFNTERSGLSGNLGIRVEDNEQYGDFFTYQAGFSYAIPATGTRIRGNLGKGMKEPTFFETSASGFSVGNPELKPEQARVWEVGVNQELREGGPSLTLTWFHQRLEDLIQYTFLPPHPGGPNFYNVAEAEVKGAELSISLPLGSLNLTGGYTYLDSEVLDSGFDQGDGAVFVEGESLIRRPTHQVSLGAMYRYGGVVLSGSLRHVGVRGDRDFATWPAVPVELGQYTLVGAAAEVSLFRPEGSRPGFDLQLKGENLSDENYQEVFGFRAPGRVILVGGRLTFGLP